MSAIRNYQDSAAESVTQSHSAPTKRSISCTNIEHNGAYVETAKPHALAPAHTVLSTHTHTHTHRNQHVTYEGMGKTHNFRQSFQAVVWEKAVSSTGHPRMCMIIEASKVIQNQCDVKFFFALAIGFWLLAWNPNPGTRNPEPETRNPEPETRNPEPGTPKPGTPEPGTQKPGTKNTHHKSHPAEP